MKLRTRACRFWFIATATFTLLATIYSESWAQRGQWFLGVNTETVDLNRTYGDTPGRPRPPRRPPFYVVSITKVIKGSAAERAGLEEGDLIIAANNRRVTNHSQLTALIKGSNGTVTLRLKDYESPKGYKDKTITLDR
jgi:S1-C subfamily serine protease